MFTNHNLSEEKGEPKRYRTEALPLTSLTSQSMLRYSRCLSRQIVEHSAAKTRSTWPRGVATSRQRRSVTAMSGLVGPLRARPPLLPICRQLHWPSSWPDKRHVPLRQDCPVAGQASRRVLSSRLVAASSRGKAECRDSAANGEDFTWLVYAAAILDAFNSLPSTRPWSRSPWRGTKVARPALTVPDTSASCLAPLWWKPRSAGVLSFGVGNILESTVIAVGRG